MGVPAVFAWRRSPYCLPLWSLFRLVSDAAFRRGDLPVARGGTLPPKRASGEDTSFITSPPMALKNGGVLTVATVFVLTRAGTGGRELAFECCSGYGQTGGKRF